MSLFHLAFRSFIFHWRTDFVLAVGMAAATAVLTGALIVGDSMRTSLSELALDRLGQIDELIVADGFFRTALADEIRKSDAFKEHYRYAEAGILFPNGSVETGAGSTGPTVNVRRATNVNVIGISNSFWNLGSQSLRNTTEIEGRQVIINRTLAELLELASDSESHVLTLRIPKPTQLPSDSALGKKKDLVESLVDLQVVRILDDESIARFGLHPSQLDQPNIFVPQQLLAGVLSRKALKHKTEPQSNVIFLAGKNPANPPTPEQTTRLFDSLNPSLEDFGLTIKYVSQQKSGNEEKVFEYYSLSSDRLVLTDEIVAVTKQAFPDAVEVMTYLANDICKTSEESGIPFSMVSAIDIGTRFPLRDVSGEQIAALRPDQIVLNQWAAEDLGVNAGDAVRLTWFEPESTHGTGIERNADFEVKAIARLAQPSTPFQIRRRQVIPAKFEEASPTLANDPDFTPEVPGLTDAESIENWDLPFDTTGIRAVDDQYWNDFRTTPKGFIALKRGQELWGSRFGSTTSFRIPIKAGTLHEVKQRLIQQLNGYDTKLTFRIVPIKRNVLAASSGSTPFDALFLALSMFVIASALILVSLLFRLTLKRRASQIGTLLATGMRRGRVSRLLLTEMSVVAVVGAILGILIGIAYAAIMIYGLGTWWLGAISQPVLSLHVSPLTLAIGAISGLIICVLTVVFTVWSTRNSPIRLLLSGEMEAAGSRGTGRPSKWPSRIIGVSLFGAIVLSIAAGFLGGEPQAGAFMGAGFLVLTAALSAVFQYLTRPAEPQNLRLSLGRLASMSGKRNPLRSTLTIGLVAVASFLIVAVSSFRLTPNREGTAGFDLIARSDQPIFDRLNEVTEEKLDSFSIRVKAGEDASCNNLYQSTQPQVLGVTPDFIESFGSGRDKFRWASTVADNANERANPWILLNREVEGGAIPVVIDKNTANYSLKIFATGGDYTVEFDTGETIVFRVVGFLENSILQGSLIISEANFVNAFPDVAGYRMFLIRTLTETDRDQAVSAVASDFEQRYSDQGFDARSAPQLLAKFQQVQNTYISTFQTLGALGMLLGTFGLATVQIRNVLERQQELGLMRSTGFSLRRLSRLVLLENVWLLLVGLAVGVGSALVTTLPHYFVGGASIPWFDLALLFIVILISGLIAADLASRVIAKLPLLQSLRV